MSQETKGRGGSHDMAHICSSRRAAGKQKLPRAASSPAAASADVATGSDQEAVNHFLQDLFCCPLTQVGLCRLCLLRSVASAKVEASEDAFCNQIMTISAHACPLHDQSN